ncbi:MAG: AmmeMemoRadiSam system protein B [bacterium]
MDSVKRAALAGQWYPGDRSSLEREVSDYIRQASVPETQDDIVAVMSPHAGYAYSGHVAGYSFRALQGRDFDTVIVVAVCHTGRARASILDVDAYETPLGRIDIDRELVGELQRRLPMLSYVEAAHGGGGGRSENSAELQIPFIQVALPGSRVVEILIGGEDQTLCDEIGNSLASVVREHSEKRVAFVASSDMTHYPPYAHATRIDRAALESLVSLDEDHIRKRLRDLESEPVADLHCVLCGKGAVLTTLRAAKELGADRAEILEYRNSGDASFGSREGVVGYGSIAVYRSAA